MKRNYKQENYKQEKDWLENRGIGGSDAAAIIGKSKWLTANDVYNRLALNKAKPVKQNELMEDGKRAETHLRELFKLNNKQLKVVKPKKWWLFRRKDYSLITVSPDSIATDKSTKEKYGIEIKKCRLYKSEDKANWEDGNIPDQYYCQILQYMVVMNDLKGVYLYAELDYYNFNEESNTYEYLESKIKQFYISRDSVADEIKYLEKKEIDFIVENVMKKTRPKVIFKF